MPVGPIFRSLRHSKTRVTLIVLEIAFTLAIVANCVNMILAERRDMLKPSGFDDEHLVWVRTARYTRFAEVPPVYAAVRRDEAALAAVPGVRAAANTFFLAWQGGGSAGSFKLDPKSPVHDAQTYEGSPTLIDTLGVKIIEGRNFVAEDYPVDEKVPKIEPVIISRAFEKLMFPDGHGVGKIFESPDGSYGGRVVGVIDKFYNPYGLPIGEYVVFFADYAAGRRGTADYLVRTTGDPKTVMPAIEKTLLGVYNDRTVTTQTIMDVKDAYFSNGLFVMKAMSGVIVLVVFVTALGLLGLTSLSVTERTRQIGTRRALGATRRNILVHFLLENWLVTTAGIIVGVFSAYALNLLLVSRVSDAKMDWRLIVAGMLLLWINGFVATIFPAWRASGVSPAIATRSV